MHKIHLQNQTHNQFPIHTPDAFVIIIITSGCIPHYAATKTPRFLFKSIFTINVHVFFYIETETEWVAQFSLHMVPRAGFSGILMEGHPPTCMRWPWGLGPGSEPSPQSQESLCGPVLAVPRGMFPSWSRSQHQWDKSLGVYIRMQSNTNWGRWPHTSSPCWNGSNTPERCVRQVLMLLLKEKDIGMQKLEQLAQDNTADYQEKQPRRPMALHSRSILLDQWFQPGYTWE